MTTPRRLPRGRHGLTRTEIERNQRARILAALADVLADRGYADTSVAHVLAAAGVSRETFYQLFPSKQDCLLAAVADVRRRLVSGVTTMTQDDPGPAIDTFDRVLAAFLPALGAAPASARLLLIETHAAGPEVLAVRMEMEAQFVDALAGLFGADSSFRRFSCEVLAASISALVATELASAPSRGARPTDPVSLDGLRRQLVSLAGRLFPTR